jgi:myo-inositol-1(or 4)-monophosphatase
MDTDGAADRAAVAERAARAGGAVAADRFRSALDVEEKGPGDVVTDADRAAQARAVGAIRETSDAPVIAEEAGRPNDVPDGPAWVIDPIDGTTNFSRGVPVWACSVAVLNDGEPVAAATVCPGLGDVTVAADRTERNGTRVSVSDRTEPAGVAVAPTAWGSFADREALADGTRALAADFGKLRRLGSMQTELALLAAGGIDAVVASLSPYPWDTIAGIHLVRQAGGRATDWTGDRWRHDADRLVASNGAVHDAVLDAVADLDG